MKLDKNVIGTIVAIFVCCLFIYTNWTFGTNLVDTFIKAVSPFIMGAGIAFIVNIVMSNYEKLMTRYLNYGIFAKAKRSISLILAYATFIAVAYLIFIIVLPDLIASLQSLLKISPKDVQAFLTSLQKNKFIKQALDDFGNEAELSKTVIDFSKQVLNQLLASLMGILSSVSSLASTLLNLFVSVIFSIYVLASKESLSRQFHLLVDTFLSKYKNGIYYVLDVVNERFRGFFVSQTIEAIILGSLTAIGMLLLRLPYATTVGVLISFTAVIPVVGAYIGTTVGAILIMTQDAKQALIFVIFIVLLQQFEGNLIYPRVVGGSIGLPGMWVLLAVTVGGASGGVFGMLLAVPLAASFYQILRDYIYKKKRQS